MSKRKLSRRQTWRAQRIQQERITRQKKREGKLDELLDDSQLGPERPGLVIANYGKSLIVEDEAGHLFRCHARQNLGQIVCGDRVIWQQIAQSDEGIAIALLQRKSLLERPVRGHQQKPVASNIDQVFIVAAPEPKLQTLLIDRYLVATELAGLEAVIVINKVDLLDEQQLEELDAIVQRYAHIGYTCLKLSSKTAKGMDELQALLKDKISILSGQSGVGKSSTIKALMPDLDIQVGELSKSTRLGKHTTSASRLYHLPFGGAIIDSPGVRDFGLWQYPKDDITKGFREFRPYMGQCKFSNCTHHKEPHCALRDAVDAGEISEERLKNFLTIVDSLPD